MRTLYIECNMGAAGDMLMAALYELLENQQDFLHIMNHTGLPGVSVCAEKATTCGISGTHMRVTINGTEESDHMHEHHSHHHVHGAGTHHHATPGHIAHLIDHLSLPESVRLHAKQVYQSIADAESKAHGHPIEEIHFHEVGSLDAVADVAGVCYAMNLLNPDQIIVSPVHVGSGSVHCAHGIMPVPAPATANLLKNVPVYGGAIQGELCTPTGAALLTHYSESFGKMPLMKIKKIGIGIGTKTFEQANCVRVFLGETEDKREDNIAELVCNIDDMTPESLAFACSQLLEQGALDVYTMPGTMKKGRSGHVLTVLCHPDREEEMVRHILKNTTTNGLRARHCKKYFLTPSFRNMDTKWGNIRIKESCGFGITHIKPEYDDVIRQAKENHVSYQRVLDEVTARLKKGN